MRFNKNYWKAFKVTLGVNLAVSIYNSVMDYVGCIPNVDCMTNYVIPPDWNWLWNPTLPLSSYIMPESWAEAIRGTFVQGQFVPASYALYLLSTILVSSFLYGLLYQALMGNKGGKK